MGIVGNGSFVISQCGRKIGGIWKERAKDLGIRIGNLDFMGCEKGQDEAVGRLNGMGLYEKKYEYQEIRVNTLKDINKIISGYNCFYNLPRQGISVMDDPSVYLQTFFRGQSDESWKIRASIENAKEQEYQILADFESMHNGSLFELIAYVQHYRTGTRFIDFSTDRDVALYFACSENMDKDGALFMWCYAPHKAEWYTACVLTELAQIKNNSLMSVQDLSEMMLRRYPKINEIFQETIDLNTAIVSFLDHGFMAVPPETVKENNLRLKRQSGCFYVCGVRFERALDGLARISSHAGYNKFYPHSVQIPGELINGNALVKIVICKELKEEILGYLEKRGITKEYLLPE